MPSARAMTPIPKVELPDTFSVEDLVNIGLSQNPHIVESQHKIAALRQRIPQALSLPDPVLNTTTFLAPVETAAGRQRFAMGISQKIIDSERRETRAAKANDEVQVAEADLVRLRQEIAEKIRVSCYRLLSIQETARITREDIRSLEQIEKIVLRNYEVDKSVSQKDVLNIQIERSNVENQLTALKQKENSYIARIARLANVESKHSLELSDSLQASSAISDVNELIQQAHKNRPELASQLAEIQKSRRDIQLANLQSKPDYTVGLNWIATASDGISPVSNGDDALMIGMGFNLPVYKSRIRAAQCEATEQSLATEARLSSLLNEIEEEIFDTIAQLESNEVTRDLLQKDILPKAERSLTLSIEEYSNGKTDYLQLMSDWRTLLRQRIALVNLRSQRMQLSARLARQIGQLQPLDETVKAN